MRIKGIFKGLMFSEVEGRRIKVRLKPASEVTLAVTRLSGQRGELAVSQSGREASVWSR